MTAPDPMSRKDLLELAALDALGMLDEYEAALYTRSFHHASAAVQHEIRELQAAIASDDSLLPDVTPSSELRAKVLRAINRAIEQDSPAPLASIGRNKGPGGVGDDQGPFPNADRFRLTVSGQFWRAAAFLLAGTVLVTAYFLLQFGHLNYQLAQAALDSNTFHQIERLLGPTVKDFLRDPSTQYVSLHASDESCDCWATLMIREGGSDAFLITEGIPGLQEGVTYQLVVRNEAAGTETQVAQFTSRSQLTGHHFNVDLVAYGPNVTWEISGPEGVILSSARA